MSATGMVCTDSAKSGLSSLASVDQVSTTGATQRLLLATYKAVCRTGLLSTRLGRFAFLAVYEGYKRIWDAAHVQALAQLVRPGTTVVDVGANVGFYTKRFAEWVRPGGEVIAIEPEEANYCSLRRVIARRGLVNVLGLQAVASERAGSLYLQKNPFHPADHRIAETGLEVRAVTIDDVLAERSWPKVSLIKIDVQGAEERVLRGATKTLQELQPAVFLEVDEAALRLMGSSAEVVLRLMISCRYEAHRLMSAKPVRLSQDQALKLCTQGSYVDFLFLPVK
jgi:FkbM family methyltransferase